MDIPKIAPLGLLHHHPDGFLITLIIPLHGPEYPQLGIHRIQLRCQLPELLRRRVPAFPPVVLPQSKAVDYIFRRRDLLLCRLQFLAAPVQRLPGSIPALGTGCQILFQLGQSLAGLCKILFQAPNIRLTAGHIRRKGGFFAPQLQKLPGKALGVGRHGRQLLLRLLQHLTGLGQLRFNAFHPLAGLGDLGLHTAGAVLLSPHFLLNPGDVASVVIHIAPEHRHLALQLLVGALKHGALHPNRFQFSVFFPEGLAQRLRLPVQPIQLIVGLLQYKGRRLVVLLRLFGGGGKPVQRIQPDSHLHPLQLLLQLQIFLSSARLLLQGLQLKLQLGNLVADAEQIVLGPLQLTLRLLFAMAVLGNSRRLFKNLPAVSAFQRQYLVNPALTDIGVALPAKTGIHQQLMNVLQPGRLAVDIILAVAGAVIAPCDHDLIGIIGQRPVGIVQRQRGLRKADSRPLGGAAEDHVFHFRAPEGFGALFAHDPEDGVGNIGFSGAVGADNGRNGIAELNNRLIREGLEALQFQ